MPQALCPWRAPRVRALAVAAVLALSACHREQASAPAPRAVIATTVRADAAAARVSLPAVVQARYSTPLSFRIAGKIVERRARLGDAVRAGDVIARLDPSDAQASVGSAWAQYDAARHRAEYAKTQLDRDTLQAHASLITAAQLEQSQDTRVASAAQRDAAAQQLMLARNQLRYTTLVADHAGVITSEDADTGQNVSPGQSVYRLAWSGDLDVVCDVPESRLASLPVGRAVEVALASQPGRRYTGRVREIAPAADPQSRTYRVKMTLDKPDDVVRIGMTAKVGFDAGAPNDAAGTVTLPATALFHAGSETAVWIVRGDDTLELRRVTVSRFDALSIAVSAGLRDGDRVVLQGVHTVGPGEKVRIVAPLHPEDFAS
ncbi:efflux RND transporter periplasmic adaptor subunit [Burkholderia sp. Bp8963]|uniref:efflux RND transporter periplasmic adaptor subunit n=1 Tax=Burkholderia sp. Bp8963 TaxID=2184547 RepID=UPI000F598A87|nr:efflux RND transporter periplasmic adaptor subunit [Burkholderia sp. Bp8963]RQS64135.1 efflux RND transporter periplasmic adaptor subunit [Burkholderia sp. Bp8963]